MDVRSVCMMRMGGGLYDCGEGEGNVEGAVVYQRLRWGA